MRALVTGGAGFIGSKLVESLLRKDRQVTVLDNLSTGSLDNLAEVSRDADFRLELGDCRDADSVRRAVEGCDVIFHAAANPAVIASQADPYGSFSEMIQSTTVLLESARETGVKKFVFLSSSTVYGEPKTFPTPEDYLPLVPISVYGASKLVSESLISSYSRNFGMPSVVLRLANIVGPRGGHGVVNDLVAKLRGDSRHLDVLGDGTQAKSYLHVDACVSGVLTAAESAEAPFEVYNLGSEDKISVSEIARIVLSETGLDAEVRFTGGVGGGRGWEGDVKQMLLDVRKLELTGWRPGITSAESIRLATRAILTAQGSSNGTTPPKPVGESDA